MLSKKPVRRAEKLEEREEELEEAEAEVWVGDKCVILRNLCDCV